MEFKRGDTITHTLRMPREFYQEGSRLHFMAKAVWDNDFQDQKAEISKEFGDENVILDDEFATYTLKFTPEDTEQVVFSSEENIKELNGEIEIRTPSGEVYSYPSGKDFIKVKVYADIRRGGR